MAEVITIANQKGGVAKTTTTAALASGLKSRGYNVLVIDLDPQGNLSDSIGANNKCYKTIYQVLKREIPISEAVQHLDAFDIVPANIMLSGAETEISAIGKEQRLKECLASDVGFYDYVIIDTPPSLGLLTINAFSAADKVIIPTTAGIFAASGIQQLTATVNNVCKYCNPKLRIAGVLLTMYNPRTNASKELKSITDQIADSMGTKLYNTFIRASVVVEEAQYKRIDILSYKTNSTVASDYESFVDEFLEG